MFSRFVALGDSFTEGVGDDDPDAPNGVRGWADRVAEQLAHHHDGFAYANLAIRGRLLQQVLDEQRAPGLEMMPDLVAMCAGGDALMRPMVDSGAMCGEEEAAGEPAAATRGAVWRVDV